MRVPVILILFIILSIPAAVQAEQNSQGHIYMGTPGAKQLRVRQLNNLPDETYVTLTGNLVGKRGDGLYTFRDSSGDIGVRIKPELFSGMSVNSQDIVSISGQMEMKNGKDILIDVKHLKIVNK